MPETGITNKIVQANNSTPGVVQKSRPQTLHGRLIKLFTSCVPRRSRASSSNINASSSPLRIENAEKFDTSQTGKFDQRSKSKQNRDAGDGEVKTELSRDNEITRKNDSPVKALEQRRATTLNAKDNPLERTNALISDDNQIKEKGNGKQKPVAGDGEVKTGQSSDNTTTSKNDASVKTLAQRSTTDSNASATRPKRKNAEIFDKNKITVTENKATGAENETTPTQRKLKKLISALFKQYEKKPDPLSCEFDDFIMYHTVISLNSSEVSSLNLSKDLRSKINVLLDEDQPDEDQLKAFEKLIDEDKYDLIKKLPYGNQSKFATDIANSIEKSRKHATLLKIKRDAAIRKFKRFLKLESNILGPRNGKPREVTEDVLEGLAKRGDPVKKDRSLILDEIVKSISKKDNEVVKIEEMIKYIKEKCICAPVMIRIIDGELVLLKQSINALKELPDNNEVITSSWSVWV